MATVKQVVSAKSALTVTGLSTLANNTYCVSDARDNTTNQPLDLLVELSLTPGTVSGNKQAILFAKTSLDGTTWSTGPESGTSAVDEANLTMIGVVPLASNATTQIRLMSVAAAFGGVLPPYTKFVIKNESGAALSGGNLNVSEVHTSIV